jgi:hypothetical protein
MPSEVSEMVAKARKLLALAGDPSASPGEAENAREAAYRLMRQAAIDEAALLGDETPEFVVREYRIPRIGAGWWHAAISALSRVAGVKLYQRMDGRGRAPVQVMVGTPSSVERLVEMSDAVIRQAAKPRSVAYVQGYVSGVCEVARRVEWQSYSRVLATTTQRIAEWFERDKLITKPKPLPPEIKYNRDVLLGYRDGGKVSLDPQKPLES